MAGYFGETPSALGSGSAKQKLAADAGGNVQMYELHTIQKRIHDLDEQITQLVRVSCGLADRILGAVPEATGTTKPGDEITDGVIGSINYILRSAENRVIALGIELQRLERLG